MYVVSEGLVKFESTTSDVKAKLSARHVRQTRRAVVVYLTGAKYMVNGMLSRRSATTSDPRLHNRK